MVGPVSKNVASSFVGPFAPSGGLRFGIVSMPGSRQGPQVQTPIYMQGQEGDIPCRRYSDAPDERKRWETLQEEASAARAATGLGIGVERIDVQPKPSASVARIADLRGSVARLAVRRGVRCQDLHDLRGHERDPADADRSDDHRAGRPVALTCGYTDR